ncbi:MAG: type IV secretory system conjugative DNA transfer family protein [Lachnospiraceae bacterium]|nr:type IV secretory system conjugative DNA transfer family protein [Lachnospiraceae bacterium]
MSIGFITPEEKKKEIPFETPRGRSDLTCLGIDAVYPAHDEMINGNELVIGSTGAGKTMSVCLPRILHTWDSSLVIPIVKRKVFELCAPVLKERGYEIWDLNLAHPEKTSMGYDPCFSIKTEDDMMSLANQIIGASSKTMLGEADPYWAQSSAGMIAALIMLAKYRGKLSFLKIRDLYRGLDVRYTNGHCRTSLSEDFARMNIDDPDLQAPKLWDAIEGNASKTAACILSMVHNAMGRLCGDYGDSLFRRKKMVNLKGLGSRKIALFITTNLVSEPCQKINSILYSDLFKQLFDAAEEQGGTLPVPVHIIADDFTCSSRIEGFADYISVFRAAGISVTLLLQSLSQLESLYGPFEASTIRNNCDSWVFLGSMDMDTCREMGERANLPANEVLSMPVGEVIVSRRGVGTVKTQRYPIMQDEIYQQMISLHDKAAGREA